MAGCAAVGLAAAVGLPLGLLTGDNTTTVRLVSPPSTAVGRTGNGAPTTTPPDAVSPPTGIVQPYGKGTLGPEITGTVTGPNGAPVANAYIIGLRDLHAVRADQNGRYAIPCYNEPLMASSWVPYLHIPGEPGENNSSNHGTYPDQTIYDNNEDGGAIGLGYAFSGGANSATSAAVVPCNGSPVNFQLPVGGNVQMFFPDQGGVLWQFSDPGLTAYQPPAFYYGMNANWNFGLLDAGTAIITGAFKSCTGTGVLPGAGATWTVAIAAGRTTNVTCQH